MWPWVLLTHVLCLQADVRKKKRLTNFRQSAWANRAWGLNVPNIGQNGQTTSGWVTHWTNTICSVTTVFADSFQVSRLTTGWCLISCVSIMGCQWWSMARFPGFSGGGRRAAAEVTAQAPLGWRPVAFQPFHPPARSLSAMLTGSNLLGPSGQLSQNYQPPGWAPQSNLSIHTTVQPPLFDKSSFAALTHLLWVDLWSNNPVNWTITKQDWKILSLMEKRKVLIKFPGQLNTAGFFFYKLSKSLHDLRIHSCFIPHLLATHQ